MSPVITKERLDELYRLYNRREYVHPDPVEFLYDYPDLRDRELVGLIASSLAYGRVNQIVKSIATVLKKMEHSPFSFLRESPRKRIFSTFSGFRHRFTTGDEMAHMLWGTKHVIDRYGSLYACFLNGLSDDDATILPALSSFVRQINTGSPLSRNSTLPSPRRGSACKRLNLFLRWMVRQDEVDPGGWETVPLSKLLIPLDTHMHRICSLLHCTRRKQADIRTAIEITQSFREVIPEDPVRYDFSLTRLGIRTDTDLDAFLNGCL